MQALKTRPGSLDVLQKPSPSISNAGRKLKTPGSDSDSVSSSNPARRTPKVVDRRSPRAMPTEKKRSNKVSELETRITQLEEELKRTKDQLSSNESSKRRAQQEADDTKKQLAAKAQELEDTRRELNDLSECEETRIQELRKLSHERDRAWQSELEAVQKQHTMDTASLASALNEIQKLKIHLDRAYQSEASQARHAESAHAEIQSLRVELSETIVLVEKLKNQLNNSRDSEALAVEEAVRTQMQLEVMITAEEALQAELANSTDAYNSMQMKLAQSENRVKSLEEHVSNLQADLCNQSTMSADPTVECKTSLENGDCSEPEELKADLDDLQTEVTQLKIALQASEKRYQDEFIQGTLEIRNAYELVELAKSEAAQRESELEAKLEECMAEVEELKAKRTEKETISCNEEEMNLKSDQKTEIEVNKSDSALEDLKSSLLDAEARLHNTINENEKLKSEIMKKEIEKNKASEAALALAEAARVAEQEALLKLGSLTEEADRSSKNTELITEQLDAAQAANSDMEAELRRLKVQANQWRKAAEAATAMLSIGKNGKHLETTRSFEFHKTGFKLSPSHSEDTDDESPKKKNGNMLKKIGVLLKKGQK